MRKWSLVVGLVAAGASAQDVSLDLRGTTVLGFAREVEARTRVPIQVDPSLANEIVIVRCESRPVAEVVARVATALCAKAAPNNEGWLLMSDPEAVRARTAPELQARIRTIQDTLDRRAAGLRDLPTFGPSEARLHLEREKQWRESADRNSFGSQLSTLVRETSPSGRLVTGLLLKIGAEAIAGVESGARVVFAPRPTRLQRPMPEVQALVDQYRREETVLRQAKGESEPPPWDGQAEAMVAIKRGPFNTGYEVRVLLHRGGSELFEDIAGDLTTASFLSEAPKPQVNPTPIAFSPATKELLAALARLFESNSSALLPGPIRARLADPVRYEPLATWVGDALFSESKAKGLSLAACVPDAAFLVTLIPAIQMGGEATVGALKSGFADSVVWSEEGGWLTATPRDPANTRTIRFDRSVLQRYSRAIEQKKGPEFADVVAFVAGCPREYAECLAPYYAFMLGPLYSQPLSSTEGFSVLRLAGLLPGSVLARVDEGLHVPASEFPANLRAEIARVLLGPDVEQAYRPGPSGKMVLSEPTIVYAARLPSAMALNVTTQPREAQLLVVEGLPPEHDLAQRWFHASSARPQLAESGADVRSLVYQVASARSYSITLALGPETGRTAHFTIHRVLQERANFDALPKQIQAELTGG